MKIYICNLIYPANGQRVLLLLTLILILTKELKQSKQNLMEIFYADIHRTSHIIRTYRYTFIIQNVTAKLRAPNYLSC